MEFGTGPFGEESESDKNVPRPMSVSAERMTMTYLDFIQDFLRHRAYLLVEELDCSIRLHNVFAEIPAGFLAGLLFQPGVERVLVVADDRYFLKHLEGYSI